MALMLERKQTVDAVLLKIQQWSGWHAIQKGAAKEYSTSEQEFYAILPEYQKFMALIALGYRGIGMWSQKVDLIWHAHILNTQRYENFCQTVIGSMVHHVPCCDMQRFEPGLSCEDPDPSCKDPEPDPSCREPDPSCKEGISAPTLSYENGWRWNANSESSGAKFSRLYTEIYDQVPPSKIWDFTGADGQTM